MFSPWWIVGALAVLYVLIPVFLYLVTPPPLTQQDLERRKRAIVMVLGDLGRSPRMNYHALSLADAGLDVDLCGYTETALMEKVTQNERITVHNIPPVTNPGLPFMLFAIRKVVLQHWYLYQLLKKLKGAEFLVVQTPPAIPVLGMSRLFVLFMSQRTKLVIDWHNFGYSILALKLGNRHLFVKLYRLYEMLFGRSAYCHLTVTVKMARFLENDFRMTARRIIPLHDRPVSSHFRPLSTNEREKVMAAHPELFGGMGTDDKVLITSTSYTPDEDLYILLDALKKYDETTGPPLRVIITGKGPMYREMEQEIAKREYKKVTLKQAWLASEDYPLVVGCADLGVSLHVSSSGVDLPMKVVDMFGCGVPAVSLKFPAIDELIKMNSNGVIVKDADQMSEAFKSIFGTASFMKTIKHGAMQESKQDWDSNWNTKIGPLFGRGQYAYHSESESSDSD